MPIDCLFVQNIRFSKVQDLLLILNFSYQQKTNEVSKFSIVYDHELKHLD